MKTMKKLLCGLLIGCLTAGICAGCSKGDGEVRFGLEVQNDVVVLGESNAFLVRAENLGTAEISYEVSAGDAFETVGVTKETIFVYRCRERGEFSVRATAKAGEKRYVSETVCFRVVDGGGENFGTSPTGGFPSINVDLSRDSGEDACIEHKSVKNITEEFAYCKGLESEKFVLTATVDIVGTNYNDKYPKTGLFAEIGTQRCYMAFDVRPDFSNNEVVFATRDSAGTWHWGKTFRFDAPFRSGTQRLVNSMTLLRDGETFYVAVNGTWLGSVQAAGFTGPSAAGTLTMSQHAVYSDYSVYAGGSAEFETALSAAQRAIA